MSVLYSFLPSSRLAQYIEGYSFYEGEAQPSTRERCLPDGRVALVINLGHEILYASDPYHYTQLQSFYGGVLHGAFSQFSVIDTHTMTHTLSVCFKPGGLSPFLPMPATELTNRVVDLGTLWGTAAIALYEQLRMARTRVALLAILERFLLERAVWERVPHPAVDFALHQFQNGVVRPSISEVRGQTGLSSGRFISLFQQSVGLAPKVFCRVLRFQELLQLTMSEGRRINWADLALTCGYFDQAHFIHDFRAFSGLTPGDYLKQRSEHYNHVPLLA